MEELLRKLNILSNEVNNLKKDFKGHIHNGIDNSRVRLEDIDRLVYGQMYSNTQTTITVSVADTWYEITSNFSAGSIKGALFGGGHYIKVAINGIYFVMWDMAIETATVDQELAGTIMINGTANTGSQGHVTVVAANKASTAGGSIILDLTAGDEVSLAVENHTLATNIVLEHGQLSLIKLA